MEGGRSSMGTVDGASVLNLYVYPDNPALICLAEEGLLDTSIATRNQTTVGEVG